MITVTNAPEQTVGMFRESLQRNNTSIRKDRAEAISEDAEIIYARSIQDIELENRKLNRERESLLDMSPTDKNSLIIASDFNAKGFVDKDLQIGLKIRENDIKLEVLKSRYTKLFGKEI